MDKNKKAKCRKTIGIGDRLHEQRRRMGYTLSVAADRLMINKRTLQTYEHGEHDMTLGTAVRCSRLYGMRISQLKVQSDEPSAIITAMPTDIKMIRKHMGYTQAAMANKLGISRASLSRYENDQVRIPITLFFKICGMNGLTNLQIDRLAELIISECHKGI